MTILVLLYFYDYVTMIISVLLHDCDYISIAFAIKLATGINPILATVRLETTGEVFGRLKHSTIDYRSNGNYTRNIL